jgi:hypothetical protein
MYMAAYDWRLPFEHLEARDQISPNPDPNPYPTPTPTPYPTPTPNQARDQFFSRLRFHIEMFQRVHGAKVAVLCHSMGGAVWLYFQQWLLSPHGAG